MLKYEVESKKLMRTERSAQLLRAPSTHAAQTTFGTTVHRLKNLRDYCVLLDVDA